MNEDSPDDPEHDLDGDSHIPQGCLLMPCRLAAIVLIAWGVGWMAGWK